MRIAVTGATGFIGACLAPFLAGLGHEVLATGRVASQEEAKRRDRLQKAGIPLVEGSLLDSGFPAKVVARCDAVIHLAAAQHEGNVPDSYFRDVNVVGTRLLVDAAVAAGVRRFVYGSTIGVYGEATRGDLDESSPLQPDNIYTRTKVEAEQVVSERSPKLETCIARISEVYGPGDLRLLKLFRAIDRGVFVMIGRGLNERQVIYIDDLLRGLLLAAQHPAAVNQTFVLCGADVMTTETMVAMVASELGRPRPRLRVPIWPFRLAATALECTLRPLGIQPPLTQRRLDFFTKSFRFSTAKYRKLLNFSPQVAFDVGCARTAAWYRDCDYL